MKHYVIKVLCIITFMASSLLLSMQGGMVFDAFKDMSEEDLMQAIEEGQRVYNQIMTQGTPEEKAAFEQAMADTMNNFSEDDWKELNNISQFVSKKDPRFAEPVSPAAVQPAKPAVKKASKKEASPKKAPERKKNTAQYIDPKIDRMVKQLNEKLNSIIQKTKSSKDMDLHFSTWAHAKNFIHFHRKIKVLSKKKHVQELSAAHDDATKKMIKKMKDLTRDLQKMDHQFDVQDTFGLPETNKKNIKHMQQLQEILLTLDHAVDHVSGDINTYLEKHEPEALEIAKQVEEKEKSAHELQKMAQTYSPKKGLAPHGPQDGYYAPEKGGASRGHGSYGYPGGYYPRGGYAGSRRRGGTPTGKSDAGKGLVSDAGTQQLPATAKDNKKEELPPHKKLEGLTEGHLDMFEQPDVQRVRQFVDEAKSSFVDLTQEGAPQTDEEKINAFAHYVIKKVNEPIEEGSVHHELDALTEAMQSARTLLPDMTEKQIKAYQDSDSYKAIKARLRDYKNHYAQFKQAAEEKRAANIGAITRAEAKDQYSRMHAQAVDLGGFKTKLDSADTAINILDRTMRKEMRRLQRDARKKATTTGAASPIRAPRRASAAA